MPRKATEFSRVSTGYDSGVSLAIKDSADTGPDFSCYNGVAQGTFAVAGAFTASSTLSSAGRVNADAGVQVGGGTVAQIISSGTVALSFGAVSPLDSSSVITFAVSGLSRADALWITPDSIWPNVAANRDISFYCSSSSTVGEANAWAINSTLTSVTPTASSFFRWTRIKFGNYPAA